jgi:hypothetical protein
VYSGRTNRSFDHDLSPKEKLPWFITTKNKEPFAFAARYEWWIPREGARLETFTIIATTPNAVRKPIHDRDSKFPTNPFCVLGNPHAMHIGMTNRVRMPLRCF